MAKRLFLFLMVNFLVVISVSLALNIFNVQPYLTKQGIDMGGLLIFCFMWGMGGALISLMLSRSIIKWSLKIDVINEKTSKADYEIKLLQLVYNLSKQAGIKKMPEVGVYESNEVNAFATGPTKNRALVAVSTGLLNHMDWDEVEGVLGHEVAHVANGDMVTMSLLTGVINSFVMFLARVIALVLTQARDSNNRNPGIMYFVVVQLLEVVLMIFGSMVVAWFSRYREYRADEGGAKLTSKAKMISALKSLQNRYEPEGETDSKLAAFKISGKRRSFGNLFATHPPLASRIARLEQSR